MKEPEENENSKETENSKQDEIQNQNQQEIVEWRKEAIKGNFMPAVIMLEKKKININDIVDENTKETLLHLAGHFSYFNVIRVLIEKFNADINQKNQNGYSLLFLLVGTTDFNIIIFSYLLKQKNLIIDTYDNFSLNPLVHSIMTSFHYAFLYFVHEGLINKHKDNYGNPLLYFSIVNNNKFAFIYLIYNKINNINSKYKKLPTGFIFKIIFISTFGDKDIISLKKFELYNEKNILLTNYIVIHDNYNENYSMNNSLNNILKNNKNEYVKNYFYYHKFFDFRKDEESICNNLLFICFEEIVQIKYIKIENISNGKLKDTSTKNIQIYCDDILIFEGELKQKGENIILFDEKEVKKFNNVINIPKKKEN